MPPGILTERHPLNLAESSLHRCLPLLRLQARRLELDPRSARRLDGPDLVQETLTRALGRIGQFRGGSDADLVRWLRRIMDEAVADKLEDFRTVTGAEGPEGPGPALVLEPSTPSGAFLGGTTIIRDEEPEDDGFLVSFALAIECLPEDQRDAVNLRDLHGCPVDEIALLMGTTEKSVAGLLLRGRLALGESALETRLSPP